MTLLNINIGVLGHVDSGKTSLSKALSTIASTASFDKNPQSKERGITLDLGFSSFYLETMPDRFQDDKKSFTKVQYTLVDCPGHASLIKTIIGGAQIIDLMMLVIDIVKGIQTQTAECLIIGEITCDRLLIVLNKVDLIPQEKRMQTIDRMKKRLWKTLESGKFKDCPIVEVAANPGGSEETKEPLGLTELISSLVSLTPSHQERQARQKLSRGFVFAVDHCFPIRGQGTVMTGTVMSGSVKVGDVVEIPSLKQEKKVKSMQMFRQPVDQANQGDRVGLCVAQFDPSQLERGLVCSPGHLPTLHAAIIAAHPIPHFKSSIASKAKFHITIGHDTLMAKVTVFGGDISQFSLDTQFIYEDELPRNIPGATEDARGDPSELHHFFLLEFERPVICPLHSLVIGSRLDTDIHSNTCRLAFHGQLLLPIDKADYRTSVLPGLKIYRTKERSGTVERISDPRSLIVKNLFKKETNLEAFTGLKVILSTGHRGKVEGGFGQSGKCKVYLDDELPPEIVQRYSGGGKKKKDAPADAGGDKMEPITVTIHFKRFVFDPSKKMIQS